MSLTSTSTSTNVHGVLNRLYEESIITEDEFVNLLAYVTNNPNKIPDMEESLKYGADNVKAKYLRKLLVSKQPGAEFSREPTDLVHVFIDNSNFEIEGKKFVSDLRNVFDFQLTIDYGRLLGLVLNGRQMGEDPIIVGSRPPPNDSLWNELKVLGYCVKLYDRNFKDKEKEVDTELGASIGDTIQEHKRPGIILLVAGDGDHSPLLRRALLRGWNVEVWFWTHGMSNRLKNINVPDRPDLQTTILNLDPHYLCFMHAYGRENSEGKKFLEINDNTGFWDTESMMECCEQSDLFCWWWHEPQNTFYMYFDNYEHWRKAKDWITNNYSNAVEFKKDMSQTNFEANALPKCLSG